MSMIRDIDRAWIAFYYKEGYFPKAIGMTRKQRNLLGLESGINFIHGMEIIEHE